MIKKIKLSPLRAIAVGGSYLRLIDFCITELKAQGPSRTCDESKEEEEEVGERDGGSEAGSYLRLIDFVYHSTLKRPLRRAMLGVGCRVWGVGCRVGV